MVSLIRMHLWVHREHIVAFVAAFSLLVTLSGCVCGGPAASLGEQSSVAASAASSSSVEHAGIVGTWTGELTKTSTNYACYGAQHEPLQITVYDIDSLGKMHVDIKVLYHGHTRNDITSDVESGEGDVYLEYKDLIATLENGKFKLSIPVEKIERASDLVISATFNDEDPANVQFKATVRSGVKTFTEDEFELTKVA